MELDRVTTNPNHTVNHIDFDSLVPPVVLHSMDTRSHQQEVGQCCCSVCVVGRLKGGDYFHHKLLVRDDPGRPRVKEPPPEAVLICSSCHSRLAPGLQHFCDRKSKRENLAELLRKTSQKSKERVLSSQLKEVFIDQGTSTQGGTVSLATGGLPIQATLGKSQQQKAPVKFSFETMNRLQNSIGASDRKMNIIGNFLRVGCGRSAVDKLEEKMVERNKKLSRHFESKMLKQKKYVADEDETNKENTEGKKKKKKKIVVEVEKPAVMVKDVEDLASHVMLERNLNPADCEIQIGIDDGQGLLKIMMTIKEKDKGEIVKGKKAKYSEGFNPKEFKLAGVKKLLIIFISPTCERYDNLATVMEDLNLKALEFGFSCDLKLVLLLCGKQCASSKHCCPYCSGSAPWLAKATSNTIGSLWSNYNSFVKNGSKLKDAMKFNNVINPPLLTGPDDSKVLSVVYFPELHVLTGIVGKLVKEMEKNVFPSPEEGKKFMDEWMASPSVNVCRTVYHGSANFVGDMARKLLKKVANMKVTVNKLDPEIIAKAAPYLVTLQKFETVRNACFGQLVEQNYGDTIRQFSDSYRSLGISITLKVKYI